MICAYSSFYKYFTERLKYDELQLFKSSKMFIMIRESIRPYINTSDEVLNLFGDLLTIWKEKGKDIDIIEARKIFLYMLKADQKIDKPNLQDTLLFERHSWVVGEYASDITRKLLDKYSQEEIDLRLTPKELEYGGGVHDIGKLFLPESYRHMHEHIAWSLMVDNGFNDLASLTEPHQPGEEVVLELLHKEGHFLEIDSRDFCRDRRYPFASDLIMLADMSCYIGYLGVKSRIEDIRERYQPTDHLVIGIDDPKRGEKRVLAVEERVKKLLS